MMQIYYNDTLFSALYLGDINYLKTLIGCVKCQSEKNTTYIPVNFVLCLFCHFIGWCYIGDLYM